MPLGPDLHVVVPGALDQATGGYRYATRIVAGLRRQGRTVVVHELEGRFPDADATALAAAAAAITAAPPGATMVIDGLALPAFAPVISRAVTGLNVVALVHHPLALETGIAPALRARLASLEPALLKQIGRAIVTSRTTAEQVAAMGVARSRIAVIEPALDRPRPMRLSRHRGSRLLCVATLVPRKGHLALLRALAGLRHRSWRLDAVGSLTRAPAHARQVRALCAASQLAGRVRFVGEVDAAAVGFRYAAADLFVLPTEHEGYGMALAEAMAHGLPVVSTRVGAVPDTVFPGAGLLVRPRDRAALRRAIRMLLVPSRRRRMAARARAMARRLPSWEVAAEKFAAALEP